MNTTINSTPDFLNSLNEDNLFELDVRPVLASGKDPFGQIMERLKTILEGQTLKITNTFEPVPLINILRKQGFEVYVKALEEKLIETYFYRKVSIENSRLETKDTQPLDWTESLEKYKNQLEILDVREMEMPLPMITILETLDKLPVGKALFIHHKRVPVVLIPELIDRKFEYRMNEISDTEVQLLIFKG